MSGQHEDSAGMLAQIVEDGLVEHGAATLEVLTGGVSSEIYLVTEGDRRFVVKRALEKLKVAEDWFADVGRNETEREFIGFR